MSDFIVSFVVAAIVFSPFLTLAGIARATGWGDRGDLRRLLCVALAVSAGFAALTAL